MLFFRGKLLIFGLFSVYLVESFGNYDTPIYDGNFISSSDLESDRPKSKFKSLSPTFDSNVNEEDTSEHQQLKEELLDLQRLLVLQETKIKFLKEKLSPENKENNDFIAGERETGGRISNHRHFDEGHERQSREYDDVYNKNSNENNNDNYNSKQVDFDFESSMPKRDFTMVGKVEFNTNSTFHLHALQVLHFFPVKTKQKEMGTKRKIEIEYEIVVALVSTSKSDEKSLLSNSTSKTPDSDSMNSKPNHAPNIKVKAKENESESENENENENENKIVRESTLSEYSFRFYTVYGDVLYEINLSDISPSFPSYSKFEIDNNYHNPTCSMTSMTDMNLKNGNERFHLTSFLEDTREPILLLTDTLSGQVYIYDIMLWRYGELVTPQKHTRAKIREESEVYYQSYKSRRRDQRDSNQIQILEKEEVLQDYFIRIEKIYTPPSFFYFRKDGKIDLENDGYAINLVEKNIISMKAKTEANEVNKDNSKSESNRAQSLSILPSRLSRTKRYGKLIITATDNTEEGQSRIELFREDKAQSVKKFHLNYPIVDIIPSSGAIVAILTKEKIVEETNDNFHQNQSSLVSDQDKDKDKDEVNKNKNENESESENESERKISNFLRPEKYWTKIFFLNLYTMELKDQYVVNYDPSEWYISCVFDRLDPTILYVATSSTPSSSRNQHQDLRRYDIKHIFTNKNKNPNTSNQKSLEEIYSNSFAPFRSVLLPSLSPSLLSSSTDQDKKNNENTNKKKEKHHDNQFSNLHFDLKTTKGFLLVGSNSGPNSGSNSQLLFLDSSFYSQVERVKLPLVAPGLDDDMNMIISGLQQQTQYSYQFNRLLGTSFTNKRAPLATHYGLLLEKRRIVPEEKERKKKEKTNFLAKIFKRKNKTMKNKEKNRNEKPGIGEMEEEEGGRMHSMVLYIIKVELPYVSNTHSTDSFQSKNMVRIQMIVGICIGLGIFLYHTFTSPGMFKTKVKNQSKRSYSSQELYTRKNSHISNNNIKIFDESERGGKWTGKGKERKKDSRSNRGIPRISLTGLFSSLFHSNANDLNSGNINYEKLSDDDDDDDILHTCNNNSGYSYKDHRFKSIKRKYRNKLDGEYAKIEEDSDYDNDSDFVESESENFESEKVFLREGEKYFSNGKSMKKNFGNRNTTFSPRSHPNALADTMVKAEAACDSDERGMEFTPSMLLQRRNGINGGAKKENLKNLKINIPASYRV